MLLARRSPAMARVCKGAPSRNRAARNERLSMHPSEFARATPDKAAIIMAGSGETVTFAQLEARSNQGAHLLRGAGLQPGAVVALMLENDARYLEITCAAHRAGLYFVCLSTRLAPAEIAYILLDSGAQMLIASGTLAPLLHAVADAAPPLRYTLGPAVPGWQAWEEATAAADHPDRRRARRDRHALFLGHHRPPQGNQAPLPADPAITTLSPLGTVCARLGFGADTIYLNPAPLYHAAPLRWCREVLALGGTVVIMEKFDPEAALALIERHRVTHSQWVPTHFVRMLKLPDEARARHDCSSLRLAIHAAAPCPVPVKQAMIDWWGRS
jgi:acyl-CoA synthetase (AMP-forming)/AMP-acid ligase II